MWKEATKDRFRWWGGAIEGVQAKVRRDQSVEYYADAAPYGSCMKIWVPAPGEDPQRHAKTFAEQGYPASYILSGHWKGELPMEGGKEKQE